MKKELVKAAAEALELIDIAVVQQSLWADEEHYAFGQLVPPGETTQQTRRDARVLVGEYDFDDNKLQTVVVHVDFGTRLVDSQEEDDDGIEEPRTYAEILATVRVEYGVISELPANKALQEFADYNAVHNAYPFWREIVFSLANRAKLPPVFVPLYRDSESGDLSRRVVPPGKRATRKKLIRKKKKSRTTKKKATN